MTDLVWLVPILRTARAMLQKGILDGALDVLGPAKQRLDAALTSAAAPTMAPGSSPQMYVAPDAQSIEPRLVSRGLKQILDALNAGDTSGAAAQVDKLLAVLVDATKPAEDAPKAAALSADERRIAELTGTPVAALAARKSLGK